ncbi:MAG: type IV secretory system conjugative DNA transfer family protein [Ferrimonas sp.]
MNKSNWGFRLFLVCAVALAIAQTQTTLVAWFLYGEWQLHWPWRGYQLSAHFYELHNRSINIANSLTVFFAVALLFCGAIIARRDDSGHSNDSAHGTARWAKKADIAAADLIHQKIPEDAVIVGAWNDPKSRFKTYLWHNGAEHFFGVAPTRSGKGVGLVLPTLLHYRHSVLVSDLKGELWELTAGWRASIGQKALPFEPASHQSVGWNPLSEIRINTPDDVGDAQAIALSIVDADGKGLHDHWTKTAFALLTGLILHVCYKAQHEAKKRESLTPAEAAKEPIYTASLSTIDAELTKPGRKPKVFYESIIKYPHVNGQPHENAASAAQTMLNTPENEGGSIQSTVLSFLSLYRDPLVKQNTTRSDFKINDLMRSDSPISLYLITQPKDKERLRPLIRLFITMSIRLLADGMVFENGRSKATYKHRLLFMLDEFPQLGKMEILQEALAYVAGYGLKLYLIAQDLGQLHAHYGKEETITSNCHIQSAYAPLKNDTANYLSAMTGEATVYTNFKSYSGQVGSLQRSYSTSVQAVKRNLLTPDEIMRLPPPKKDGSIIKEAGDMLIFSAGRPAIYGKQVLFFQDPVFLARSKILAPDRANFGTN